MNIKEQQCTYHQNGYPAIKHHMWRHPFHDEQDIEHANIDWFQLFNYNYDIENLMIVEY